ncbi:perlucin-like [Toxorhynchites rutilus septentrionalis]|uniref:perlucin-like n=1 Tax=Toxorhynchites rutilus septentrionalis TaxID=329112 RepID=UPI002479560F|nr:perlucin-like [Toxorhynchites rutilus septentrionalis]
MFLLTIAVLALFGVLKNSNAEILGNQTVRDILLKNKCLCPCGASSGLWKNFLIPYSEANWFEAVSYCSEIGMSILQISSKYDNKDLQDWLNENGEESAASYWIGANDLATSGVYRWGLTNKRASLTQWASGEPNSATIRGEIEHCVEIRADTLEWNDSLCSKQLKFICEKFVE